jgi:hypothetical protein
VPQLSIRGQYSRFVPQANAHLNWRCPVVLAASDASATPRSAAIFQ